MEQPRKSLQRMAPQTWSQHKGRVKMLYLDKNLPLREVMHLLARDGFDASVKQYKAQFQKWGWRKYSERERTVEQWPQLGGQRRTAKQNNYSRKANEQRGRPYQAQFSPIVGLGPGEINAPMASATNREEGVCQVYVEDYTSLLAASSESLKYTASVSVTKSNFPSPATHNDIGGERFVDEKDEKDQNAMEADCSQRGSCPVFTGPHAQQSASSLSPVRPKSTIKEESLACPFRARNPLRFNVRDHRTCAQTSFDTISALKRHVRVVHGPKDGSATAYTRPGCAFKFDLEQELSSNLCLMTMPTPRESKNAENGISAEVLGLLADRKWDSKLGTWDSVFKVLFPEDAIIPKSDYQPPVEIAEVAEALSSGMEALKDGIRRALTGIAPELASGTAASVIEVVETFHKTQLETCRQSHHQPTSSRQLTWNQSPSHTTSLTQVPRGSTGTHVLQRAYDGMHSYYGTQDTPADLRSSEPFSSQAGTDDIRQTAHNFPEMSLDTMHMDRGSSIFAEAQWALDGDNDLW